MVELKFRYLNIDCFNGFSIRPLPTSSVVIFTSREVFLQSKRFFSASCFWLTDEKGQSSTNPELVAIYYVNYSNANVLDNKKVQALIDNDNAATIVLLAVPNHIFKH